MVRPMELFDTQFRNIERGMEIATRRQEVITHNIANAKTPGFEPLAFDEELMAAVKRLDRKEVVLEEELSALTENSVKYSSYVKLLTSKINMLRTIATQGRR
ncbi:MAG: flagellar basal body protein [Candidatus Margulisiibacteriota bacterium]